MRILHVIPNLLKGGAQRLAVDICNEFAKTEKVECKLVVLSNSNGKNEFAYCSSNIEIIYCNVRFKLSFLRSNIIEIEEYEKVINEFKPNIIHSHLYFAELICHENPRNNIKYISHLHSNISVFKKIKLLSLWRKEAIYKLYEKLRLKRKYLKSSKKFISISNYTSSFFNKNMDEFSNNVISLSNSIDFARFKRFSKKPLSSSIKLISVGNLLFFKNQIFLLDIVKYLKSKNYSVHLNIVGDGEEKKSIAKKIDFLKIKDDVTLSGQKDLIEEELMKADFYLHSSKHEAFGLVILEAMASRLPVIALNGSGNKDLIKNGVNGYIIDDQNPKVFGDIIIDLFCNKDKYQKISEQGFQTSLKYDLSKYIKKLLKIYNNR